MCSESVAVRLSWLPRWRGCPNRNRKHALGTDRSTRPFRPCSNPSGIVPRLSMRKSALQPAKSSGQPEEQTPHEQCIAPATSKKSSTHTTTPMNQRTSDDAAAERSAGSARTFASVRAPNRPEQKRQEPEPIDARCVAANTPTIRLRKKVRWRRNGSLNATSDEMIDARRVVVVVVVRPSSARRSSVQTRALGCGAIAWPAQTHEFH